MAKRLPDSSHPSRIYFPSVAARIPRISRDYDADPPELTAPEERGGRNGGNRREDGPYESEQRTETIYRDIRFSEYRGETRYLASPRSVGVPDSMRAKPAGGSRNTKDAEFMRPGLRRRQWIGRAGTPMEYLAQSTSPTIGKVRRSLIPGVLAHRAAITRHKGTERAT